MEKLPKTVSECLLKVLNNESCKLRVQDIEGYFMVHRVPRVAPCQHIKCDSKTEINMMYHPWLYTKVDMVYDELQLESEMYMGVFEACNVYPVHQDIASMKDRGVAFGALEMRNVFIVMYITCIILLFCIMLLHCLL